MLILRRHSLWTAPNWSGTAFLQFLTANRHYIEHIHLTQSLEYLGTLKMTTPKNNNVHTLRTNLNLLNIDVSQSTKAHAHGSICLNVNININIEVASQLYIMV